MLDPKTAPDHQDGAPEAAPAHADMRPVVPPAPDDNRLAITLFQSASVIVSLALHAGAAAAMLVWLEAKPGAISVPTEAITIELIASEVIEAAEPAITTATSAVASAPDAQAGSTHAAPAREERDTPEPVAEHAPQHAEDETSLTGESRPETDATREPLMARLASAAPPDEPLSTPELSAADHEAHEPIQPESPLEAAHSPVAAATTPTNSPDRSAKQSARSQSKASAPSRKGGTPSRAVRGSKASAARASASTGAALNYASIVRARVASRRPPGQGQRGTVYVTFGISPSGGLTFANVSRSSGDPTLDRNVLAAVRSAAPFPAPPAGASLRQRQFSMPFHFQ